MFPNEPSMYSSGLDTRVGRTAFSTIIWVGVGMKALLVPHYARLVIPKTL